MSEHDFLSPSFFLRWLFTTRPFLVHSLDLYSNLKSGVTYRNLDLSEDVVKKWFSYLFLPSHSPLNRFFISECLRFSSIDNFRSSRDNYVKNNHPRWQRCPILPGCLLSRQIIPNAAYQVSWWLLVYPSFYCVSSHSVKQRVLRLWSCLSWLLTTKVAKITF